MATISDKIQIVAASSGDTVPQALGRLRVALEDSFLRASRDVGLTSQQAELLCAVMQPAAVGDLAQTLRCDRSNVSRMIDRASARGLLTRGADVNDGRVTVVELTVKGKDLARRFLTGLEAQTDPLKNRWSSQRRQIAVGLLNELSDTLDASKQPPPRRKHQRFAGR